MIVLFKFQFKMIRFSLIFCVLTSITINVLSLQKPCWTYAEFSRYAFADSSVWTGKSAIEFSDLRHSIDPNERCRTPCKLEKKHGKYPENRKLLNRWPAWCQTGPDKTSWNYCVTICSHELWDCHPWHFRHPYWSDIELPGLTLSLMSSQRIQEFYRGRKSTTYNRLTCQPWKTIAPKMGYDHLAEECPGSLCCHATILYAQKPARNFVHRMDQGKFCR